MTDVRAIFDLHGDLVWRALARAGVRDADLRDATQEVFVVVARRIDERDASSSLSTWLYGIALRVAANHRRKVQRRREELSDVPPEPRESTRNLLQTDPERAYAREEARVRLAVLLDALPDDLRAVFTLYELDELPCPAIAERLGLPLGTVYTRLRAARARFQTLADEEARA